MSEIPDSYLNINGLDIVTRYAQEADRIENDPAAILALVELILGLEPDHLPPS